MELTNEQHTTVASLIKEHHASCPACGSAEFAINSTVLALPAWEPDRERGTLISIMPGTATPVVAAPCVDCGHLALFAANVLGIV